MVTITANSMVDCVSLVDGRLGLSVVDCYGAIGVPIDDSRRIFWLEQYSVDRDEILSGQES